jgi:preprotein translocase subunit YajC
MSIFSDDLLAQTAGGAAGSSAGAGISILVPLLLMIVIMYFLMIRPQNKKEKTRLKMINEIQPGDRVVTVGGIYGIVSAVKADQNIVVLKISENSKVEFAKSSIQEKLS